MKKSMKVLVTVALLLSATLNASAQFSKKGGNRIPDRFHMGIRGGASYNTYFGDSDYKGIIFPTGGIALDFQVAPIPIFIGTGLNYVNYGCKMEGYYNGYYQSYRYDIKKDGHSIQMPVTVSYHINVAPNLFINPFAGEFIAYNFNKDFNKQFNYGLRIGCGLNFGRLTFDLYYDLGLENLGNDRDKAHSETFFMTVGFNLAGNR